MQLQRSTNGMHVLAKPSCTFMPAALCRGKQRDTRCRAYDPDSFRRLMFLPGGAWFMSSNDIQAPVYGDSFVMHSPAPAGRSEQQAQGLVPLLRKPLGVAVRQPQQSREIVPLSLEDIEVSIVVLPVEESTGIVPFKQMLQETATDANSSPTAPEANSNCLAIVPKDSTMLGVVMGSAIRRRDDDVQLPMNDEAVYETFNTKHPRRTMKIKFKCQRCGATTIKPINPHAWTAGTVFAKCGRCNITHKLIDNLKLFHELAGPVFNDPIQPAASAGSSSSSSGEGPLGDIEYDANGLPVLPERLQLRLNQWQAPQDFPDDISNYN